jgi:hypothetical protein
LFVEAAEAAEAAEAVEAAEAAGAVDEVDFDDPVAHPSMGPKSQNTMSSASALKSNTASGTR